MSSWRVGERQDWREYRLELRYVEKGQGLSGSDVGDTITNALARLARHDESTTSAVCRRS